VPDSTPAQETRAWPYVVLTVPAAAVDEIAALCHELGSCGLQCVEAGDEARLTVYYPPEAALDSLAPQLAAALAGAGLEHSVSAWEWEGERDWLHQWRAFYKPVWATPQIVVHPPWLPVATRPDQVAISIEPRMAFGTGGHESTQLCLQGIGELDAAGLRCLDVGTGSGVLSIALVHLGASQVVAVDVDPVAVENAQYNAAQNLAEDVSRLEVRHGSVEAASGERFDLIAANIEGHLLRPLLGPARQCLAPGGKAVFSGILGRERAAFEVALREAGFEPLSHRSKNEWICLVAEGSGVS